VLNIQKNYRSIGEKLKNKNKLFVCATLMMLLCSFLVSSVSATDDNTTIDPTPDTPLEGDNPVLIVTEDNATTIADGDPKLYQARDNSTNPTDPSTANDASESDNGLLISTQSSPDYTGYLEAGIALVAAIAISSFVIVFMKRKK
jgi:hypothetical protein